MGMVICPSTGQSALLPEDNRVSSINYLVFDPVDKQFKVLNMSDLILTLGTGEDSWRQIYCPLSTTCLRMVCLKGYASMGSEEFKFTYIDFIRGQYRMINYKGKLGVITLETCLHISEDELNQCIGCSHVSTLWKNQIVAGVLSVVGVTVTGDIVLCMEDVSKPLYVFYLNIERKTLQRVEFRTANNEAFEKCSSKVILSVDHVEDLNFINMET
ncbi:hypothetical protein YC2023_082554 [Brassica napus]